MSSDRCVLIRIVSSLLVLSLLPSGAVAQFAEATCMQGVENPEQAPGDGDWFGYSISSLGDLDGVAGLELAIGAPSDHEAVPEGGLPLAPGAVWIQHLDINGMALGATKITPNQLEIDPLGVTEIDQFGASVAALGDVNGDGVCDLAVGALSHPDGGVARGAVYILFLTTAGTVSSSVKLSSSTLMSLGVPIDDMDAFGSSLACMGDFDGDGWPDLVVGAMGRESVSGSGEQDGGVFLFPLEGGAGNPNAGFPKSTWSLIDEVDLLALNPVPPNPLQDMYLFGSALCPLGDLDGDGNLDLCVGVDYDGFVADDPNTIEDEGVLGFGALYLLLLDGAGGVKASQKVTSDNVGGFTELLGNHDVFGASLALMDTGPNTATIAVGAFADHDGGYGGAFWVLDVAYDGGSGSMGVVAECKYSGTVGTLTCAKLAPSGWFGAGVASLGDVYPAGMPDGVIDLAVGEPHRTPVGVQAFRGKAWVLPRGAPTVWKDMQHGLPGTLGDAHFSGTGTLLPSSMLTLDLNDALANAPAFLILGFSTINEPFKGGVLIPAVDIFTPLTTSASGSISVSGQWPGAPSGSHFYSQFWIQDPAGPAGFAASNGLSGMSP